MSGDLIQIFQDTTALIQLVILATGFYRSLEMRRGFVDATYRSKALWSALLMSVIALTNAVSLIPLPNNQLWNTVTFIPFLALVGFTFAFVDKTVLVAIKSDFFHRDILRWSKLRVPAASVLAGSGFFIFSGVALSPSFSVGQSAVVTWVDVAFLQFSLIAASVLGFAALALAIGAHRTSDRTLKKHIRLLGFALTSFAVSLVIPGVGSSDAAAVFQNSLTLVATYLLYLSTMSLTSLGHLQKEDTAISLGVPRSKFLQ